MHAKRFVTFHEDREGWIKGVKYAVINSDSTHFYLRDPKKHQYLLPLEKRLCNLKYHIGDIIGGN